MRYEDASGTFQASGPIANDDADTLSAGQRGPATGNLITGEGTQYGAAGADSAAGAQITAIAGKGGEDSSFSGGKLSVAGEHGRLTVDADGNYSYLATGNVENVRDRFTYTLADNDGNTDTAALIVEIGKTPAVIKADAQQVVPGPDGVVTLPPGVELSDVRVVGRNLVVDLPDGTQLIIIDGAVFVPQLVLGGVEVPATNVAALLIGQEVQPAAGEIPPSGGGNFALPPPPLDPGIPLGDLIPPTELDYIPPEPEEVIPDEVDRDPEITIQPDGQPASVNAVDSVDEKGLPTRNEGEPEGSGEEAAAGANGDPSEATAGTIIIDSPDGVASVTINGVLVTGVVGQTIAGDFGMLTVTGFDGDNILYSYVLNDNTSGNDTQDDFEVVLTDDDGDTATATLTIDIIDDVPTARPDTDAIAAGEFGPVTGNVITDASAGDAGDGDSGADTVGADGADLTAVTGFGSTTPFEGGFTVNGQYGVLTINLDGSYSYTRNEGTPGGVNDVFNYTLTDGDGDTSTTTLTISIADTPPTIDVPVAGEDGTVVNEKGLPTRDGEPAGSGESADGNGADNDDASETTSGVVNFTPGDAPATIMIDGVAVTSVGQTFNGDHGILTITAIGANSVSYSYTLSDNTSGDATSDSFAFSVTDNDGDVASGNLVIDIIDDVPSAANDTDLVAAGTFGPETGNVITGVGTTSGAAGADVVGADNAAVTGLSSVNVPANVDNDAAGGFVVNGQYGVLTMQADGSYSYVRNPGTPGGVDDVFTYSLTDGDGDVDTATLTISIADSPVTLDAPDQGEAGTVVDEKGLPTRNGGEPAGSGESADGNGADNDDTSETTAGTITYTAPDAPATITIDGVAVTSVGQTFAGSFGTLTITSIADGSIGYSYTLADNTSGDATADDFAIAVTDADGDVANDTLVIDIIDDVPAAVNDTDTVPNGETTATGNVITDAAAGDAGDGDNGADTVGADNASISGLASNNIPANSDNDPVGGFVVVGEFGTLTMQADGNYSYVRADGAPGTFQDVFTYTLTDGDGDSDTATLTIDISDSPTTLDVPTQGEAGTLVSEVGLPTRNGGEPAGTGEAADGNGADNDDTSETTAGVISFTAPDAPATVTIDGVAVTGTVGQTFNGAHGVLTITSYDAVTGQIGYSYTLADNTSGDATFDDFAVVVTDNDGDSSNATLTINIVDDAPIAVNDTDSIPSGQFGPATGNVITDAAAGDAGDGDNGADNVGADNAQVSQIQSNNVPANIDTTPSGGNFVVNGQYGVLTIGQDGSYSYVRNEGTPGGVQDVFTYTLTDGDGDTDTATLTIDIGDSPVTIDAPDEGEAGTIVDEKGLPTRNGGEPAGTGEAADGNGADNDDASETTAGTITYSAPDAPATITIDGVAVTSVGQTFNGAHGVLTITSIAGGSIGYSYTLADNTSGDATFDDFALQITDADGDVASDTLTIDIIDDEPTATNDVDTIIGGNGPATGNVITGVDFGGGDANGSDGSADNVGADDALVSQIQSNNVPANSDNVPSGGNFVVTGQYGVLTIGQNGNYSYLRNDGTPGGVQDVFTYTLTDGDGDTVTATLTISIDDNFPSAGNVNVQLDDETLPGGIDGGTGDADPSLVNVSGNLPGSGGDAPLSFGVLLTGEPAGFDYVSGGAGVVLIQQGGETKITVTVNPDGSYTVVQNNPIDHAPGGNENDAGPLVVNYTVSDNDGDTANGTITINVDDDTPTISASTDQPTLAVDETNLAANAGPTSFAGVFTAAFGADGQAAVNPSVYTLGINPGVTGIVDTATGQAVVLSLNGGVVEGRTSGSNELVFTVSVDGSGNVTLDQLRAVVHNDPADHDEPGASAVTLANDNMITLTRTITDGDGDTASATADIGRNLQFEDDGPDAVNDSANQATENTPVNVDVHANDSDGADDVDLATGIQVVGGSLTGTGNLVYNGDGTFTYTPAAGEQGSIQFQYRLTDRDGDSDVATVTINLQPDSTPNAVDGVAAVDDEGLANGNLGGTGDLDANAGEAAPANPSEAIFHGQLVATGGNDTVVDYDFASMGGTSGSVGTETVNYSWNNASSTLTATISGGARNGQELFNVVVNQATGEYTLTLVRPVRHVDEVANQENDATTNLTFTVTDNDGDTDTGTIVVTFDDDLPEAIQPDPASLENEAGASVTADLDDDGEVITDFGADGPGLVQFANIANGQDSTLDSGGVNITYWLSNNGQTLQGRTNSTNGTDGQLIFTVQINQATGDYTVTMTGTIDNGAGVTFNNLTSTKAGNVDVRGVGADDPATTVDLLLTASKNGANATINTDSDSIGSDNQSMDVGETVRVDFVTNLEINAGLPSGFSYDGHVGTNSLLQTIPQVQGSEGETVAFQVHALNTTVTDAAMPDDTPGNGFSDSTIVNTITHVTIDGYDVGQTPVTVALGAVGVWTTIAYGVSAQRQADGSVIFTGVQQGDQYGITTSTDFNAFAVTGLPAGVGPNAANDSSTDSFDLGVFSIGSVDTGDPINVSYDLQITDADGDTVTMPGAIDITFNPATESLAATTFNTQSVSKTAANDDYSSLYAGDGGQKANGGNGFGNVGNTGIVSSMVAASGLAAMSTSSLQGFNQPSFDSLVQDSFQQFSTQLAGRESLDEGLASISFGSGLDGSPTQAANLSSSGFSFDDHGFGGRGLDAMSFGDAEPAYVPSYASGEPAVANIPAFAANVPSVSMASAEMLRGVSLESNVQHGGAIEQIVADSLGHNAPTLDGVLANLPGGVAELAAIANLATQGVGGVPAWDMMGHGAFSPAADMLFKVEAAMIHQDAVQPA